MSPVIRVTREELMRRRGEILRRIELTDVEFERLRQTHSLSGLEWEAREELDEIDFLLGRT